MKRQRQPLPRGNPNASRGVWVTFLLLTSGICSARAFQEESNEAAESGGFLSSELPLKVLVTTPSNLADGTERLAVQDQQALTVVFSRSVIALGQDFGVTSLPADKVPFFLEPAVPGRFRWVTTYIARWDPDGSWPLDSEVKFTLNKKLTTHDGILFRSEGNERSVILTTPSLSMDIGSVQSAKAVNLTDNQWDPDTGLPSDILPEVPPDGVIKLKFNTKVSLTALQENLKVFIGTSKEPVEGLGVKVQPCYPKSGGHVSPKPCLRCKVPKIEPKKSQEEENCAEVSFDGELQLETGYVLSLAEGVQYSKRNGPLKAEKKFKFGGLRKFIIPFLGKQQGGHLSSFGTNFLRMWLPHGLEKTAESDIQALKQQFTLMTEGGDDVDFELELENKGVLRIVTSFLPETNYKISVDGSSNILDGFGLPLESSSIKFWAEKVDPVFQPFHTWGRYAIFEAGEDWGQKVVAAFKGNPKVSCAGLEANTVNIFPVVGSRQIKAITKDFQSSFFSASMYSLSRDLGDPIAILEQKNPGSTELVEVDIKRYLNPTGLVATEYCRRYNRYTIRMLINESDMQALILGTRKSQSIVWVTSMTTGKPVQGASVTLFDSEGRKSVPSIRTDAEGRGIFSNGLKNSDYAHVEYRKKSLFIRNVLRGNSYSKDGSVSLVLDRRLVKPGETLHIKGYIRGSTPTDALMVSISPRLNPDDSHVEFFHIKIDKKFGSFQLDVPVPKNAIPKQHQITVSSRNHFIASDYFVVGNPRPPTVGLTVDAPRWAKPDSKVEIKITAESFIGAAVGDAKITLKWSISGGAPDGTELKEEVELITDSLGKVSTKIDLGSLEKTPPTDESLKIKVSWVGPTRELLEESASVLLRKADLIIDIDRTVESDFPGQEFGAKLRLSDLQKNPVEKRTVALNLKNFSSPDEHFKKNPNMASQPLDGPIVDSCKIETNSEGYDCRFSIPDLGYFALEACVVIDTDSGEQLCRVTIFGRTKSDKLKSHLLIGLVSLTSGPHKVGDRLKFGIENPYRNAKALVMWGSISGIDQMIMPINDISLHEFSIDLGENCELGCRLSVGVMVPRQTEGIALNPKGVPVSNMFDLAMPHSTYLNYEIVVTKDAPVHVEISFPDIEEDESKDFVISPGEKTTIQVNIPDPEIDEAEVTVIAVDKSILELLPYALKDLTEALELDAEFHVGFSNSGADLVSPKAIETLIHDFKRKQEMDPWFEPSVQLDDLSVDQTKEEYVNLRSTYVTVHQNTWWRSTYSRGAGGGSAGGGGAGGGGAGGGGAGGGGGGGGRRHSARVSTGPRRLPSPSASGSVRVLEDFVSTALFETVIAKGGIATVNFTAPDNLGTFNIRAYVATANEKYGSVERELIVRRVVSLTSSAPRFARVGDEFEAGAVVTVSGTNPSKAEVSVAIELLEGASLEIVGKSQRIVKLGEDGTEEVRFQFKAKKMGEAKFKITAEIEGQGASDALVINFPVEGLQEAVTVATSFAIDGNSSSQWQEGLQLPQAVPGSGAIAIQAGVGRLPAVLSMADQLYKSNPEHKCPIDATFALALVAVPFVTETYKVLDLDPASLDGNTLEVINGIQSNFTSGLESLQEMTRDEIGLDYVLNCYYRTFPEQPSLAMNALGVFLLRLLKHDLDTIEREVVRKGIPSLRNLNEDWIFALEKALLREAKYGRYYPTILPESVALARAALGGDWVPPEGTSEQIVGDLSMERLSVEFDSMDVESQTYYILTRISMDGGENHPDIQKAIKSWTSNFRVTGRTAYIARSKGSSTPASNIANSLALMVMLKAKVENQLLGKLANYVSSPPVSQYGYRVFSNFDKAVAMVALRNYDLDRGSNQPDLKLEVKSGEANLLDVQFSGNANPVASSSTPWEALASPPEPLEFRADGIGEVTLAAALTFVPADILPFSSYRGIFVQRSISIADSEDGNKVSLKTIPVTSVVEVSVQFTTPDRLGPTTVRVLMPAGLEPLDPNIAGSGGTCPVPFVSSLGGGSSFFFTCPDQETEPSVVTFRYNSVNAGTHSVRIRAVAATAGTFALPPVKAFVNKQPEVMGLSPGGGLEICSGANCVAVENAPPETPKSCPNDCSGNGACDLDCGVCLCLDGFMGEDCGQLETV
ncbi:hypothetical protein BSKO_12539 [Bryopsis sp. KO-2023]|nr:hypothetical protein BSKO_12539 [Bryopsis sp. KO-2023]